MPIRALRTLLRRLFAADEFRRFITGLPGWDDELGAQLPSASASLEMLLDAALEALDRRGLLGMAFFVDLVLHRPNQLEAIAPIAHGFGLELSVREIAAHLSASQDAFLTHLLAGIERSSLDRPVHHAVTLALANRRRWHDAAEAAPAGKNGLAARNERLPGLAAPIHSNEARSSEARPRKIAHSAALGLRREIESHVRRAEAGRAVLRLMDLAHRFAQDRALLREALLLSARVETWRQTKASGPAARHEWIALLEEILVLTDLLVDASAERAESSGPVARTADGAYAEPLPSDRAELRREALIHAVGLSKRYGSRFALHNISVSVFSGTILGVVGPNGAGKTTLLRILAGELRADRGDLCYPQLGAPVAGKVDWHFVRSQIGYVPQRPEPWRGRLAEHLHLWAATCRIFGRDNVDIVDFYLERLGLTRFRDARWHEVSGGYQTRAALARALVGRPRFVVLDEPLAALDVRSQFRFLQDICDTARSSASEPGFILSSQHIPEIETAADAMICLKDDGEVWFQGARDKLGQHGSRLYEFGGDLPDGVRERLWSDFGRTCLKDRGALHLLCTPRETERARVIAALSAAGWFPPYLRDITDSTTRIFWEMEHD